MALFINAMLALLLTGLFIWRNGAVNYVGGDAEYYYYYLRSAFVSPEWIQADWLTSPIGLHHHPIGVSILLLPFFLLAYAYASITGYALDGVSAPFQVSVVLAAIVYMLIGFHYFRKLCRENQLSDMATAIMILLMFAGTNLLHYTVSEAGMSHVYSFAAISAFLYFSFRFTKEVTNSSMVRAAFALGMVLLIRPNNVFVVLLPALWFGSFRQGLEFIRYRVSRTQWLLACIIPFTLLLLQLVYWRIKEGAWYSDRYAGFGFDWLHPHFLDMLFGFNAGFFIYTPLCLICLFGLLSLFKRSAFAFLVGSVFLLVLFYFLSSYSAYTYWDGLGIRVLVDYYAYFGFLGAGLFHSMYVNKLLWTLMLSLALISSAIGFVYFYQANTSILLRAGMTFEKWKYIFLRTDKTYQNAIGGANDITPMQTEENNLLLSDSLRGSFDYTDKDYGVLLGFDSLKANTNRVQLEIDVTRVEKQLRASSEALICVVAENKRSKTNKYFTSFKLNSVPAESCCEPRTFHHRLTANGSFSADDTWSVFIWNTKLQPFAITSLRVKIKNYPIN